MRAYVAALLMGVASAQKVQKQITQAQQISQDIAVFKAISMAREQISEQDKLDKIDNYLDRLNAQIRENLKNDVEVTNTYIRENLQRFKEIMNKSSVRTAVDQAATQDAVIEFKKQDTTCNMNCVKTCLRVTENRFENVEQTFHWCAVPICDCEVQPAGPIGYTYESNFNEQQWDQLWSLDSFGEDRDLYDKYGKLGGDGGENYKDEVARAVANRPDWEQVGVQTQELLKEFGAEFDMALQQAQAERKEVIADMKANRAQLSQCDLNCSADCLAHSESGMPNSFVEVCMEERCACPISAVQTNLCASDCKAMCSSVHSKSPTHAKQCLIQACQCGATALASWGMSSSSMDISGGSSSSISMDISGFGPSSPSEMPPPPKNRLPPNNRGWGVPCNQYCRANCQEMYAKDTDMFRNDRIRNCMIYSCACDLGMFSFGGNASAGPNGSSASVTMPDGQTIGGSASVNNNNGWNSNSDWNSGSSSSWNSNSSSNWNDNSSSSWNSNSNSNWNSNSNSSWDSHSSISTGGSSSWDSSSSSSISGGSSINSNTSTSGGSIHMDSNISTGDASTGIHSSIDMGDGGHISANAGGASASIDISGFPSGAYNYSESHDYSSNSTWNQGGNVVYGDGIDFAADVEGNVKVDWSDVARIAQQWGISANDSFNYESHSSMSGSASVPNMNINSSVDTDGNGAHGSINMGGQSIDVSANAGGAGASIHMDGFGPAAAGSYNYSEHQEWSGNWNASQNGEWRNQEGIDFAASIEGTVSPADIAAIHGGFSGNSSYNEHAEIHGNENIDVHGGASVGPIGGHSSIDMNGQHISSDVKVNPDGSMSGNIDMGDGQSVHTQVGPGGASSSINSGSNNQFGGWSLVQLPTDVQETPISLMAVLVTGLIVAIVAAGVYFIVKKLESKDSFRRASKVEKKSAFREKINFLESQDASVEQQV